MRTFLCTLLVFLIALSPALAAPMTIDTDKMSVDELTELRDRLNDIIDARKQQAAEAPQAKIIPSGKYTVGVSMPQGRFVVYLNEGTAFGTLAIYHRGIDGTETIVDFEPVSSQLVFGAQYGDVVELSGVWAIPLEATGMIDLSETIVTNGGFVVGRHLPAGEYVLTPTRDSLICSYSIQDGPLNASSSIRVFSYIREPITVELSDQDYITLTDCMIQPK